MIKRDYTNWSKDELVEEVKKLSKRKKYGLVWEESLEDVVEQCKSELPVLTEAKDREVMTDKKNPTHILIEGDNYHTLSVLNYTHKGKVDVIYIDPPYNTGAKDWKYNNHYVDTNDAFRHSKWICMMQHRMRLAKNLLKKDGILLTAIDDNEFASLKLLLEDILPSHTHEVIIINHHPQGSGGANVSATHEYCVVSVPKGKHLFFGELIGQRIEEWSLIKAGAGKDYYRQGRPNMFFAIHIDKTTGKAVGVGPALKINERYPTEDTPEGFKRVYPLDKKGDDRRWRYGRETMLNLVDQGRIKASLPNFSMKVIVPRDQSFKPLYSNWTDSRYNAGPHGTTLLREILPKANFPFPKSLYTVLDLIAGATRVKKDALVLDFFAGSGTTGHVVLKINKDDGGTRRFILCTNNENGIAEEVCFPRIKKVIKGYKGSNGNIVEGLAGNLKYFKTEFVDSSHNDKNKKALVDKSTDMICLKESCFEMVEDKKEYKIFKSEAKHTAILFDLLKFDSFKDKLKALDGPISVYIFSLSNDDYSDEFSDIKDVTVSPIPSSILKTYRKIFGVKK